MVNPLDACCGPVVLSGDVITVPGPPGSTEVVGILGHLLPPLGIGFLNWNGVAWVFSPVASFFTVPVTSTAAMTGGSGQAAFLNAAGAAVPTDASAYASSVFVGFFEGTVNILEGGGIIPDAQFTTVGGQPANGANVWLAMASDDGGTAAGKLTAVAPVAAGKVVERVGVVISNANYAALKTASVLLQPATAIQL